jgi:hypothetical protein
LEEEIPSSVAPAVEAMASSLPQERMMDGHPSLEYPSWKVLDPRM